MRNRQSGVNQNVNDRVMKQIEIIGNVGREPRERMTSNGQKFYEFSVAVNEG